MNKANVWVSILFLSLGVGALYAADATTDDLPPVPFIIGGDDVVSPAQSASTPALTLPEDAAAMQDDTVAASTQGDLSESTANHTADDADINELPAMTAEAAAPAPAQGIVVAEPIKQPAPAAAAEVTPTAPTSQGLLPGYSFEEAKVTPIVAGNDGSRQMKGLEHTVSNPLLPAVAVSPAVATVGQEFPELHVDQIPLQDLLMYLKDFTPKNIRYELNEPMAVTVDLKAKSVDEVWSYLMGRYPLSIVSDAQNVYVRKAQPQPVAPVQPVQMPASQPVMMPVQMPAPVATPAVAPAPLPASADVGAGYTWIPATAEAMSATSEFVPGTPSDTNATRWEDVRTKARLYELNKERQQLLNEKAALERATRKAEIQHQLD